MHRANSTAQNVKTNNFLYKNKRKREIKIGTLSKEGIKILDNLK